MERGKSEIYREKVVAHFIRNHFQFNWRNVNNAVRDLVYFRGVYGSVEECLDAIYPKKEIANEAQKEEKRRQEDKKTET